MSEPALSVQTLPRSRKRPAWAHDLATVQVLLRRDLARFFRERTRIAGAIIQPLIFWLVIGSGMSGALSFVSHREVSYLEYFYPGIVVIVALFTAIFTTMSVVEDRHSGFLQAVLVAPGSRAALVVGKCAAATCIALIQVALFVLLAPFAGFDFARIDWPLLVGALSLTSFALTATGFWVAWWLDSTQGYHVVMSVVLIPLWVLSGAMFPASEGVMGVLLAANPMSYALSLVRRALYGGALPEGMMLQGSAPAQWAVVMLFAAVALALAIGVCYRRR